MAVLRPFCARALGCRGESLFHHSFRGLFGAGWPFADWQELEHTACTRLFHSEGGLTSVTPDCSSESNLHTIEGESHHDQTRLHSAKAQEKGCIAQAQHWTAPLNTEPVQQTWCNEHIHLDAFPNVLMGLTESANEKVRGATVQRTRAFTIDGGGGTRQPIQMSGAFLHRTIYLQSRGFRSSPHGASWFWPSQDSGSTPTPSPDLDTPPLEDNEPSCASASEDPMFSSEAGMMTDPIATNKAGIDHLDKGPLEGTSAVAGPWWLYGVLSPVSEAIVVLLDRLHSTGLPWWSTIMLSVVLMRAALLPLLVLQIKKTVPIGMLFGQVEAASGPETSYLTKMERFAAARKATKCPNPAWFLATPAVQVPLFVSATLALRQMAMESHAGFDTGGIFWFSDLTQPAGLGLDALFFPMMITTFYLSNIQLGFGRVSERSWFLGRYKRVLQVLAAPAFVGSFYLPQGLLLYWFTNNLYSFGQHLALRNRTIHAALNLPRLPTPKPAAPAKEGIPLTEEMVAKMGVNELLQIAATCQAQGRPGEAVKFLRRALVKSPEEATVHFALGKTHAVLKKWEAAAEFYDQAAGYATDDDLRGKALYGGGIAIFNQGRVGEAVRALREAAALRPDHLEGQLSLASVLSRNGDKAEALEVVRKAVHLEPKLQKYVEQLEKEIRTQADAANHAKTG